MEHSHEVLNVLGGQGRHLRELIPGVYSAYVEMDRAAMADGAVSAKTKQFAQAGPRVRIRPRDSAP